MRIRHFLCAAVSASLMGAGSLAFGDVEAFNAALVKANETRKQASAAKHEWRDTAKLLKNAQKAAEGGDFDKAMALVAEAQLQSEQAVIQAERESKLWEGRVIR